MNPANPSSFNHRTATLSTGITYHFVDQLPPDYDPKTTKTLLLCHGFPDIWYGWRYQIGPWAAKYRVVAVDMLGYGGTDKPDDVNLYSTKHLSDDLAALLDFIGVRKAVIIGHDWGAYTVGRFALYHPDRLLALVMLSVPYSPPSTEYISLDEVVRRVPNFEYQASRYLADPSSAPEIESNLHTFVRVLFAAPGIYPHPPPMVRKGQLQNIVLGKTRVNPLAKGALSDQEVEYYVKEFSKGMYGPTRYYATSKIRFDEELAVKLHSNMRPDLPVLFFWGTGDLTLFPDLIKKAHKFIAKLENVALQGSGHWVMVESKDEVTNKILDWLDKLEGQSAAKL